MHANSLGFKRRNHLIGCADIRNNRLQRRSIADAPARIRHAPKPSSWAFDFATCGADLAQVGHLGRDPQKWTVKIHELLPDGVKAYPSATPVVDGKFACRA